MSWKKLLFLVLYAFSLQLVAQDGFDPEKELPILVRNGSNVGMAAACIVDGELFWAGSEGYACREQGISFSDRTKTRIASISKCFTAVAVMQLAERHAIELDAPIGNYLPDLPVDKMAITIRQLMAHTSGIPQYQNEKEVENRIYYPSLQSAMEVFIERSLLFEPGTSYFYTTYGYVLLGRIIEVVSGLSFGDYMRIHVFEPAGMNNTRIEHINDEEGGTSCLYHKKRRKAQPRTRNDLSNRIPGGGFISTLEDLLTFGKAIVDHTLIQQKTLGEMLKVQPVEYDGNKYGLGWFLYGPPPNEELVIGHSGGQTGCTSQLMIVPKTKTVVVVLSNTSGNYPEIATFASGLVGFSESGRQ